MSARSQSGEGALRVLHLIDGLRIGGAERQLVEVVAGLREREGMACDVVSLADGVLRGVLERAGGRVYLVPRRWRWDAGVVGHVSRIVRQGGYRILHSWEGMVDVYAVLVKAVTGARWVAGSIRTAEGIRGWREWLQRALWVCADAVLANSRAGLCAFYVGARQGRVIYNGIDLERFSDAAGAVSRESLGIGTEDYVVGMLANLTRYKDQPTLIRAGCRLLERGVPLRVVFVGDGPTRAACESLARQSGWEDRFLFLGRQLYPERLIPLFDVGVLVNPPTGEGCSNAVLECMAMGKPVVVTDAGGNPELIRAGENGYLVGVGDDEGLSARLATLYYDAGLRSAMGARGRDMVRADFSRQRMVSEYVALYRGLVERRDR